jgi:hypothetical protein
MDVMDLTSVPYPHHARFLRVVMRRAESDATALCAISQSTGDKGDCDQSPYVMANPEKAPLQAKAFLSRARKKDVNGPALRRQGLNPGNFFYLNHLIAHRFWSGRVHAAGRSRFWKEDPRG